MHASASGERGELAVQQYLSLVSVVCFRWRIAVPMALPLVVVVGSDGVAACRRRRFRWLYRGSDGVVFVGYIAVPMGRLFPLVVVMVVARSSCCRCPLWTFEWTRVSSPSCSL